MGSKHGRNLELERHHAGKKKEKETTYTRGSSTRAKRMPLMLYQLTCCPPRCKNYGVHRAAPASLEPPEEDATMSGEEGGENEGLHSHELDEDVEGGARGVLEGISNGVTNDGRLVRFRAFRTKSSGVL